MQLYKKVISYNYTPMHMVVFISQLVMENFVIK